MTKPLRLVAQDEEDLQILSAHLQDAIIRVGDLAFLPRTRRFAAVLNRFCWSDENCQRMRSGLHFDGVLKAKARNFRQGDPDAVVELLAIFFVPGQDGAGSIEMHFAGGGMIRLEVECIDAVLTDIGGPWPCSRPQHDLGEAERNQ